MTPFEFNILENKYSERIVTMWLATAGVFALLGNAASDIWLIVTCLLFLAFSAVNKDWSWLSARWVQLAFLFWAWLLFTSAISDWPSASLSKSAIWIRFPIFAVALPFFLDRYPQSFRWLKWSLLATLLVLMGVLLVEKLLNPGATRLYGTWQQSTKIGWLVVGFGLPVSYWALAKIFEQEKAARWAVPLVCALLVAAAATGEIYVTLSFLFGVSLFLLFSRPSLKVFASIAVLVPAAIGSLFWLAPELSQRFYNSLATRIPWMPSSDYYMPWSRGLKIAELNPLVGIGARNHSTYCYQTPEVLAMGGDKCYPHPHQLYIQTFAETGIIGLVIFLAMIAVLIWSLAKGHKLRALPMQTTAALCLVATVLWPISTYSHAFGQHKNFFTWFVIAWAFALAQSARKDQGERSEEPTEELG